MGSGDTVAFAIVIVVIIDVQPIKKPRAH